MRYAPRLNVQSPVHRRIDSVEDIAQIGVNIAVPETQYAVSFPFKPSRTRRIPGRDCIMPVLRSVHFDHQLCCQAGEVRYVGTDRNLPAKMRAKRWHAP
jgi:hypothetical protein